MPKGERFLRRSLQDAQELEEALIEAKTIGVRARLLHLLMVFYERFGRHDAVAGHVLEIPVARQDLAALVGVAPETVSRVIRKLEEDELLHFEGHRRAVFTSLDAVFAEIGTTD